MNTKDKEILLESLKITGYSKLMESFLEEEGGELAANSLQARADEVFKVD